MKSEEITAFSFELQHIYLLATECSEKQWDNRAHTIEAQCSADIDFNNGNIIAVILPTPYLNTIELVDFLYNEQIETITYSLDRADPAHMSPLLISLAENYLKAKGVL